MMDGWMDEWHSHCFDKFLLHVCSLA